MHKQKFLTGEREMIKGKYKQWCLTNQFGEINIIGFIQMLAGIGIEFDI